MKMGSIKPCGQLIVPMTLILFLLFRFVFSDGICQDPLIMVNSMEDGAIMGGQLSASSKNNEAERARLNGDSAWRSEDWPSKDPNPWIQVSFIQLTSVKKIATQGRPNKEEYTSEYYVQYTIDGHAWFNITNDNGKEVFTGNENETSTVVNNFSRQMSARTVRIWLLDGQGVRLPLRFELYGCQVNTYCEDALGMTNESLIESDQLSDSSDSGKTDNARLFGDTGWGNTLEVENLWFQVMFGDMSAVTVTAIATQGRRKQSYNDADEYVKEYEIMYDFENNQQLIRNETGGSIFIGNSDGDTPVFQRFERPIILNWIRIYPTNCEIECALRFELYGSRAKCDRTTKSPNEDTTALSTYTTGVSMSRSKTTQAGVSMSRSRTIWAGVSMSKDGSNGDGSNTARKGTAGTIAGVTVGIAVAVVILIFVIWLIKRRSADETDTPGNPPSLQNGVNNLSYDDVIEGKTTNGKETANDKEGGMPEYAVVQQTDGNVFVIKDGSKSMKPPGTGSGSDIYDDVLDESKEKLPTGGEETEMFENSIYAATCEGDQEGTGKEEEGWEDNVIYAMSET